MTVSCPQCSSTGRREAVGTGHDVWVQWCPNCNLVFDGLAGSGFRTAGDATSDELPEDVFTDCVETARAALERAQIAKKLKGKS